MESGYGKHVSGDFNYGGIKTSNDSNARYARTQDYVNGQLVTHSQPFRNFDSVLDFCKYKVDLLSNNRYNVFNSNIGTNSPYTFAMHILSRGYGSDYGG
jgi:flagellum-specific peptidoglycan hydrolase FlgJ